MIFKNPLQGKGSNIMFKKLFKRTWKERNYMDTFINPDTFMSYELPIIGPKKSKGKLDNI